jgi:hypothetical protein
MDFGTHAHGLLLTLGTVLSFKDYPYEDGGKPTDKIMIVLHKDDSSCITFSFTTSQLNKNSIPTIYREHKFCSCDLAQSIGVDFFFFKKNKVVGESGWSFDDDCIVLFQNNIKEKELSFFESFSIGNRPNNRIKRLSSLNNDVMIDLLTCISKSEHITQAQEIKINQSIAVLRVNSN